MTEWFLMTGGSGGIGAALAPRLTALGFKPLIGYAENQLSAQRIADQSDGEAVALDLTDLPAIDQFVGELAQHHTILAGVVLGAAPAITLNSFGHTSEQAMESQWRINVLGHQRLLAGLVRKVFRKRKQGIVLGILSEAMGTPMQASMTSMGAYIIAKYGLQGLLSVLKAEYQWLQVDVCYPGFTDTAMLNAFDDRFLESLKAGGKVSTPEAVADQIGDQISRLAEQQNQA